MTGLRMASSKELLELTLNETASTVSVGTVVPRQGQETYDLAVVATALLRKAYLQATAVSYLASSPNPETAIPNLRSLLEAFGELNYLLDGPDRLDRAHTAFLFALREIRDFLKKWGEDADELTKVEQQLEEKGHLVPGAHRAALDARNFWTTSGRAELINKALDAALRGAGVAPDAALGRQLYKLLSWDEHHVMATFLAIELNPESKDYGRVKAYEGFEAPEEFLPFLAAGVLGTMLADYHAEFSRD